MRHILTTNAIAQRCSLVLSRLDYCNSLLVDQLLDGFLTEPKLQSLSNKVFEFEFEKSVIIYTGCKTFKTTQRKVFSARTDINTLDHRSKNYTGCQ